MPPRPPRPEPCDNICGAPDPAAPGVPLAAPGVSAVRHLRLRVTPAPWPPAVDHAAAIAAHFARRQAANPAFHDGQVFVLRDARRQGDTVEGLLSLERFSAFLAWRDGVVADATALDGFVSALVQSAEGHVMAVEAAAGTLNAGRIYLPGGFIDGRDALPDGTIDLDAGAARELAEETGLNAATLQRSPGYVVVRHGRHCGFSIVYRSALGSNALRAAMLAGLLSDRDRELAGVVVIRTADDLVRHDVLDHARLLIGHVLGAPGSQPAA